MQYLKQGPTWQWLENGPFSSLFAFLPWRIAQTSLALREASRSRDSWEGEAWEGGGGAPSTCPGRPTSCISTPRPSWPCQTYPWAPGSSWVRVRAAQRGPNSAWHQLGFGSNEFQYQISKLKVFPDWHPTLPAAASPYLGVLRHQVPPSFLALLPHSSNSKTNSTYFIVLFLKGFSEMVPLMYLAVLDT